MNTPLTRFTKPVNDETDCDEELQHEETYGEMLRDTELRPWPETKTTN